METNNRRDFLKKAALAGASALVAPSLFAADGEGRGELSPKIKAGDLESKFIIRKSKFPQNPKRSVRFSGKRTKRSVQKRKARNTQKAETKVL